MGATSTVAGYGAHLLANPVDPVMPRIWDDLWAQHGPMVKANQFAAVEAEAEVLEAMGGTA